MLGVFNNDSIPIYFYHMLGYSFIGLADHCQRLLGVDVGCGGDAIRNVYMILRCPSSLN